MLRNLTLLLLLSVFVFSCKKKVEEPAAIPCSTTLYGFNIPAIDTAPFNRTTCTFGIIDTASGSCSTIGTFQNGTYSTQGAINTSDGCYYTLIVGPSMGPACRITMAGVSTALIATSYITARASAIIYSQVANKLYTFCGDTGGSKKMWEAVVSGSSVTALSAASSGHPWFTYSSTVDNNTGTVYCMRGGTTAYIEKCTLGSSSITTIDSIILDDWYDMIGLQFNTNDNMLYAINSHFSSSAPSELVKINPSGGHTTIATLSFTVNPDHYSSAFDQCHNRYILSAHTSAGTNLLARYATSGALTSYHTTSGLLMGLAIRY